MDITPAIKQLIDKLEYRSSMRARFKAELNEDVISVDNIASKLAALYEKMRNSVDYKEEHLIRRSAIERMLKRQSHESFRKTNVSRILIVELVRAGYLPNNSIPERIVNDIEKIIYKYTLLKNYCNKSVHDMVFISSKILSLEATEIEEYLFHPVTAIATADAFYLTIRNLINVKDGQKVLEEEKNTQTYIACYRSLLRYDEASLFYRMWLLNHPNWTNHNLDNNYIQEVALNFESYNSEIERNLSNPLNWRITYKLRNYAIYFSLIKESIDKQPELWTKDSLTENNINEQISSLLAWKYKREKKIVVKSVTRMIIYIILTKIVLAFTIEIPFDILIEGHINKLSLAINVIFHPLLLFVVTRVIKLPKDDSKEYTIKSIIEIIEGKADLPQLQIWIKRKKSLFSMILGIIYLIIFAAIFGGISWILITLKFNVVSGLLFLLFLTIVSYFGLRIRNRAKKWRITPKNATIKGFIIDLLIMPIVHTGQWISEKFSSANVFVFAMDFFIETPFQIVVEVFEGFTKYLKEKKEELD